jgi:metal-sulfur cluster biosynthetic enzyme
VLNSKVIFKVLARFKKQESLLILMVSREQIIEVLKIVEDPELHLDVWTLGLIYELKVEKNTVFIKMTFTTPMCPYGPLLLEMVEGAIKSHHKAVKGVKIQVVFDPPWEPSEELRAMFGV